MVIPLITLVDAAELVPAQPARKQSEGGGSYVPVGPDKRALGCGGALERGDGAALEPLK